ncbi:TonB-dependent receptor [Parasaccharibacter apium]|uniref:TonB-dependent receptor n=1 Tax=Parasaccharibacter apium TaxID=1510841 RepID=UPI000693597B|nr:TonB-dependent receptor [Parasaccharibacter apium]
MPDALRRHLLLSSAAIFLGMGSGTAFAQTRSSTPVSSAGKTAGVSAAQHGGHTLTGHRHGSRRDMTGKGGNQAAAAGTGAGRVKAASHPRPKYVSAHGVQSLSVHASHVSRAAELVVPKSVMKEYVPGTSPYKALDRMPGVSFTSTDPFGIDSFGANLYVRGFFMNQLGVTLDGIPLNDQTYQSVNGLSLASAIIPDDIGSMTMSQGGGGVDVPSTNTLGGTIRFTSSDPSDRLGGKVSQAFGSYGSYRTYARFDSGRLNDSGTKFYTSYARTDEGMWEGKGDQFLQQVNAKLVQPLGERSRVSAFFDWTDLQQQNYPDLSLGMINNLGWRVPHLYPDYGKAYQWAQQCNNSPNNFMAYPGSNGQVNACQMPYYDGGQHETNFLGGLNLDLALTDHLTWHTTAYGHAQSGNYSYTAAASAASEDPDLQVATPNGVPLYQEVWKNSQQRFGINSSLDYRWGHHRINTGVWYENNNQTAGLYNYLEPELGAGAPVKAVGPYNVYGPADRVYNFRWRTNVVQTHLQDTYTILKGLTLTAGFRSLISQTSGGGHENDDSWAALDAGGLPSGSLHATGAFLPHFNLDWRLNRQNEFYIDVSKNMRAYEVSGTGVANSLFSVPNQQEFLRQKAQTKPARAWTYMGGYRFTSSIVQLDATVYHSTLMHELLAGARGTMFNPISEEFDFGRISMTGANGSVSVRPLPGLIITNTLSYNKGTYDRNVTSSAGTYYPLKGKNIVNYPAWMYKASIAYTWRGLNAHFDANYFGRRYYSFMNDTSIGSYWLANTGVTYTFRKLAGVRDLTVSFNVYNLFNNRYIAMMGENNNPPVGDYQSLERGATREYFGTISAAF